MSAVSKCYDKCVETDTNKALVEVHRTDDVERTYDLVGEAHRFHLKCLAHYFERAKETKCPRCGEEINLATLKILSDAAIKYKLPIETQLIFSQLILTQFNRNVLTLFYDPNIIV